MHLESVHSRHWVLLQTPQMEISADLQLGSWWVRSTAEGRPGRGARVKLGFGLPDMDFLKWQKQSESY